MALVDTRSPHAGQRVLSRRFFVPDELEEEKKDVASVAEEEDDEEEEEEELRFLRARRLLFDVGAGAFRCPVITTSPSPSSSPAPPFLSPPVAGD